MTAKKDSATIVGIGARACAVCCAGPILAILVAIGLGTAAGAAAFGFIALAIGGAVATSVVVRRRRRVAVCSTATNRPTLVELTSRPHR